MNSSAGLSVGKEHLSFCTRCKMDLAHTIMSMIGGLPSRVMCRTCKSEHNYKPKRGVTEPGGAATLTSTRSSSPRAPRESKAEKAVPIELEWMKQLNAATGPKRTYAANESFSIGDRVTHPMFGEGVVQKHVFPNKMEIIFKSDIKTLIHAGAPKK